MKPGDAREKRYAKTDSRHWKSRIFKRGRGAAHAADTSYSVQIQYAGRREKVPLHTADASLAAARAAGIYKSLLIKGWEETLKDFAPHRRRISSPNFFHTPTLGDFIREAGILCRARPASFSCYVKAIRKVYADVHKIRSHRKYDAKRGGARRWEELVDGLELSSVTPQAVAEWRHQMLARVAARPAESRSRRVTINSLIRNARALFARKHLTLLRERLMLPDPLPFEGISLESPGSMRYQSRIDARAVMAAAQADLQEQATEQFKILALALNCGLRKAEIDSLLWSAFDFGRKVLRVESNAFYQLKSDDSAGEIDLSDEMAGTFKRLREMAHGQFVIESGGAARVIEGSGSYRCQMHFDRLNEWLRAHGVSARKPLHELRKEVGSLIAAEHGIYEASRFLRHSDIRITSAFYLDRKKTVVAPVW